MNSWVLLLAALAAGCLRFGSAEGDPLPPSLVELVRTSPISSIEDLQQLLEQETDSQEVEPDESSANEIHSNDTRGRYRRNLVDAQPAQQAVCKVRTEVMEVTRAMLDRRNANFLLWPPCVEVQRCSGCCNTRMLQCVPTVTQTRYLQVTRIQYIDKRPHYDKAVISVEDHASCRCQTHPSAAARSTSLPPPPPRLTPKPPSLSKEDLHRHDNMKANQRFHVDDRGQLERQWQNKYTLSHTQPRTHTQTHPMAGAGTQVGTHTHTQPRTHTQTHPMAGSGTQVGTHTDTHTQMGPSHELPIGHGSGYEGGRGEERGSQTPHRTHTDTQPNTGERQHIDNTERTQEIGRQQQLQQYYQQQQYLQQQRQYQQQQQQQQQQHQQHQQQQYQPYSQEPELRTQYKHNAPQSDSSGPPDTKQPANHKPELVHSNTEPTDDNDSSTEVANRDALKDTEVTSQGQAVTEVTNHGKEDDKERHSQTELSNQEQKHSESTNQGDSVTEEESRKKLLELLQRELGQKQQHHPPHPHLPHQDHHHPHHRQSRTQTTTTQRPVPPTLSSSRAPGWSPSTPSPPPKPPQGPFRPALPRGRRRRKHRSRISKAALRTMIM